ncbi:coronin-1A [Striga asiatica]|uniref:Coronin-1A n=1 Tax=Striga asiatica TaxID=4170 RepID=A0A5A7QC52_STRAF|nr:coronin-1A [Striga asiatica]
MGRLPASQLEIEPVNQTRYQQLNHAHCKTHTRTNPSSRPKRYHFEIIPPNVDPSPLPTWEEPLGPKIERVGPNVRVASYGPNIDQKGRALRDEVTVDHATILRNTREGEWGGGVEAKVFLDDGLEIGESTQIGLRYESILADDRVELLLCLGQDFRVPEELGYSPLNRARRCVRPGDEHRSLTKSRALISISVSLPFSPSSTSFIEIKAPNKSMCCSTAPCRPSALRSSITLLKNVSNLLCSFFILDTTPCRSKPSSTGIKSPMFNTPDRTMSSTTIPLNSSDFSSTPPNTRLPRVARASAFVAQTYRIWPRRTGACCGPAFSRSRTRIPTSS